MKKIFLFAIVAFGAGIILATQASAGVIAERMHNQKLRIRYGVISGELTRSEARLLKKEQRRIHRLRKVAWADGKMTRREWRRLEKLQNRASYHIYRLKHNPRLRRPVIYR